MCGISGSGKTRYAKRLVRPGYTLISADRIAWQEYGPNVSQLPPQEMHRVFAGVNNTINRLLAEALERGERVVVDSTMCKRSRRDQVSEICRQAGVNPLIVYLEAPYEVLARRLADRDGSGPDDQIITEGQLRHFCSHFEAPQSDENYLKIP